jgi:hypothetical protein
MLIGFSSLNLFAQHTANDSTSSKWSFSAWAEVFILPDEQDYFNPTFYARTKTLHLEGRYNYEDLNTVSLWVGRRFLFGDAVNFVVVPMGGVVLGNTNGLAPGLEMEIIYKKLDFYTEAEQVFDFNSNENNFFYAYSELALRPIKPIRFGMTFQRTRLFESERELSQGGLFEYYYKKFRAGAFYFNPFADDQYWLASVSVDF